MLVLSRHRNEDIIIGGDIIVSVVDIRGDKTRIGVVAPKDIPVHRREVFDSVIREGGKIRSLGQSVAELSEELAKEKQLREKYVASLQTALANARRLEAELDALRRENAELKAAAMLEPKGGA